VAKRILVAHPEAKERARLVSAVRRAGLDPIEAHDGDAAIARGKNAEVALVAARLGRRDGLEVSGRLRAEGGGRGPAVVLLNDVYPVAQPRDRFLKDFGLSEVIAAPADGRVLADLLGRLGKLPRRSARATPRSIDLADTPLALLLARTQGKGEMAFVYARHADETLFLVLAGGGTVQVQSSQSDDRAPRELLHGALRWRSGKAQVITDPNITGTSSVRIDLRELLDELTTSPLDPELTELVQNHIERAGRVVFEQPSRASSRVPALTHDERELLRLIDGVRSVTRLAGLADIGRLPLAPLLFRLEALGQIVRRRPGSTRRRVPATTDVTIGPLPCERTTSVPTSGLLDAGDLGRLLVRASQCRSTATLAIKRAGQTLQLTLRAGRIAAANAWGDGAPIDDPVQQLASHGELRPADVPVLRRLHAQRLLVEELAAGAGEWSLRSGESAHAAEAFDFNPAAMVTEQLRAGRVAAPSGPAPRPEEVDDLAAGYALTAREASAIAAWAGGGATPSPSWLAGLTALCDPESRIGRPLRDRLRALAGESEAVDSPPRADSELDDLFDRAMSDDVVPGDGPPRESGGPAHPERSFTLEQTARGVVICVGGTQYPVHDLIEEVEELRRERSRLRTELNGRHEKLAAQSAELLAARHTSHELDSFLAEMKSGLVEKDEEAQRLHLAHGEMGARLAEFEAILPEKDRLLEQESEKLGERERELARLTSDLDDVRRQTTDVQRERDGLKERTARLEEELDARAKAVAETRESLEGVNGQLDKTRKDLALARAERDELTTRLMRAETRTRRKPMFRDARPEKTRPRAEFEQAERLAEERRQQLEAVRTESVELSHRVIELESQVARRDAELARLRRERERIDEKLNTIQGDLALRTDGEGAHRERWQRAERLLAEKSTALQMRDEELDGMRQLRTDLERDLAERRDQLGDRERGLEKLTGATEKQGLRLQELEAERAHLIGLRDRLDEERQQLRATLVERDESLSSLGEERSQLRARIGELDADVTRRRADTEALVEDLDRVGRSAEEARQIAERATSAIEVVRSAREELAARLSDAIAQKSKAEEERERHAAEARRLQSELTIEREARAEQRSQLEGRLEARGEEFHRLEDQHRITQEELGGLRDRMPALEVERDGERAARTTLEETHARQISELETTSRLLAETRRERDRLGADATRLTSELDSERAERSAERAGLEQTLATRTSERERAESTLAETRSEVERLLDRLPVRLEAERTRFAELRERHDQERARVTDLEHTIAQRDDTLTELRLELEASTDDRHELQQTLEARISGQDRQLTRLNTEFEQASEAAASEIATWKARSERFEEGLQRAKQQLTTQADVNEKLGTQMNGARKRIAQDVRRISELVALADGLRNKLQARERQLGAIEAEAAKRSERVQRLTSDLEARTAEADTHRTTAGAREKSLVEARDQLLALSQHDRELSETLAEQEEMIANLKASLQRLTQDRQTTERRLREEVQRSLNEAQVMAREANEARTAATSAHDEARSAQVRERQLRSLLARREAEQANAAATNGSATPGEAAMIRRLREANARIANLEQEMASRIAAEAGLRGDSARFGARMQAAIKSTQEAKDRLRTLEEDLDSQKKQELDQRRAAARIREQLAEREGLLEMRDLLVAERDATIDERDQLIGELHQKTEQLGERVKNFATQIEIYEQRLSERDIAYQRLKGSLAAREKQVDELQRKLVGSRERRSSPPRPRVAAPDPIPAPAEHEPTALGAELPNSSLAPAPPPVAPRPADAAADSSRDRLDVLFSEADAVLAAGSHTDGTAAPTDDAGTLALISQEKEALLKTSNRLYRELASQRDELDRRNALLEHIERQLEAAENDPARYIELETERHQAEDDMHQIQASLGVARVRMADLNRRIVEKNRRIQQLMEENPDPHPIDSESRLSTRDRSAGRADD